MSEKFYQQQVELLLDVLPVIQSFDCFALKGGTAINLFVQDMPRLSVDIDLTYLPIEPRDIFLRNLNTALEALSNQLESLGFGVIKQYAKQDKQLIKLLISRFSTEIKIEPNIVLRGSVFGTELRALVQNAQERFLQSQQVRTLALPDLYAGKICAALDRQHPRDLFDIKLLFESEGITDEMRQAFVIYLASGPGPMNELLAPDELDMRGVYNKEFVGMTNVGVSYDELHEVRSKLIKTLQTQLTKNERQFLLSIKMGKPDWNLLTVPNIKNLPALQWKLLNIKKMNKTKHSKMSDQLKKVLGL
ncbi:MAG: hypothetical protein COV52_05200 [Gammaproteobacteria bacterium CG11_big_fil_rev_8_21_14_0_20_46_22]|nr:MAG: hypothetical protein COW05_10055 [Gammaproteobacteria bacterium CG12_big_fil_rev_8_21_14_0_65_46_12]PIR11193.1 MAG: hypothetical protein COV52_05200 [Gammaproteobacteria bacterium CG11_big_fil_rev_8_21_14_0_20_46_22]